MEEDGSVKGGQKCEYFQGRSNVMLNKQELAEAYRALEFYDVKTK